MDGAGVTLRAIRVPHARSIRGFQKEEMSGSTHRASNHTSSRNVDE
jgi:hypothetical protein